jgi:hypothetical protein
MNENESKPETARLACTGECDSAVEHELEGRNGVRRPVWSCSECGETRVGPFVGSVAPATNAGAGE